MATSINVILEHFSLALAVFEIFTFKNSLVEVNDAIPWQMLDFPSYGNSSVVDLSFIVYEIFANEEKMQKHRS